MEWARGQGVWSCGRQGWRQGRRWRHRGAACGMVTAAPQARARLDLSPLGTTSISISISRPSVASTCPQEPGIAYPHPHPHSHPHPNSHRHPGSVDLPSRGGHCSPSAARVPRRGGASTRRVALPDAQAVGVDAVVARRGVLWGQRVGAVGGGALRWCAVRGEPGGGHQARDARR